MSWTQAEMQLSQELNAYCKEHNLGSMCAEELYHEIWAVTSGEKSNFVPPYETDERLAELIEAKDWLSDFIERWDAATDTVRP